MQPFEAHILHLSSLLGTAAPPRPFAALLTLPLLPPSLPPLSASQLGNYANTTGYPNFTFASNASALTQPADGALIQPSVVDSDTRDWCFRVLLENPLTFDSFPWAVGQCECMPPAAYH